MGNIRSSRLGRINRLVREPFAPYVDSFKQYLTDRGYAASTFANYAAYAGCDCSAGGAHDAGIQGPEIKH